MSVLWLPDNMTEVLESAGLTAQAQHIAQIACKKKDKNEICCQSFLCFHQPVDSLLSDTTDNETARLLEKGGV